MWSTVKDRSSISHVPSLPAINNAGNHSVEVPSPTPFRGSMEGRMLTLELSNKALLEEMMHVHAALRKDKEETKNSLSELLHETSRQLLSTQASWQGSYEDTISQTRRVADRLARLERSLLGVEGIVAQERTEKEKQEVWLKDCFSSLHEHVSWLTKKMDDSVSELSNTLKSLDDRTTNKHAELVTMVTTTLESRQAPLEQRVTQLEKVLLEDQDSSKQLSATVGQMKDNLNALSESYNVGHRECQVELDSLRVSLKRLAREDHINHQELSTVLQAEIKTRLKALSHVRAQCAQVHELCRGSVHALREGVLSLEERMSSLRKEIHIGHEQQVAYCQEIGQKLQADLNVRLSSLQHHLQVTKEPANVHSTGTFLTTIAEEDPINSPQERTSTQQSRETKENLQTVEQSQKLLAQSKLLLDKTEELKTSRDANKQVLEQLQSNLKQSEQLLDDSKLVQSNLEQSQQMCSTRTNLDQSNQVLEQVQAKLTQSKDVLDQVQSTLNQSKQVLEHLRSQLEETRHASSQVQLNLNHSKAVLQQLQSNVDQSHHVLDETTSTSNLNRDDPEQKETHTQSGGMELPESDNEGLSQSEPDETGMKILELETGSTDDEETSDGQSLSELESSTPETPEATPPDDDTPPPDDDTPPPDDDTPPPDDDTPPPDDDTPPPDDDTPPPDDDTHTPPTQLTPSHTPPTPTQTPPTQPTSDKHIDDTYEARTIDSDEAEDNGGSTTTQTISNSETSSTSDDNLVLTERGVI